MTDTIKRSHVVDFETVTVYDFSIDDVTTFEISDMPVGKAVLFGTDDNGIDFLIFKIVLKKRKDDLLREIDGDPPVDKYSRYPMMGVFYQSTKDKLYPWSGIYSGEGSQYGEKFFKDHLASESDYRNLMSCIKTTCTEKGKLFPRNPEYHYVIDPWS